MTTQNIAQIKELIQVGPGWYGDFSADYDTQAIDAEYLEALEALAQEIVPSVRIFSTGNVIADLDDADAARDIDYAGLASQIEVAEIAERHSYDPDVVELASNLKGMDIEASLRSDNVLTVKILDDRKICISPWQVNGRREQGQPSRDGFDIAVYTGDEITLQEWVKTAADAASVISELV